MKLGTNESMHDRSCGGRRMGMRGIKACWCLGAVCVPLATPRPTAGLSEGACPHHDLVGAPGEAKQLVLVQAPRSLACVVHGRVVKDNSGPRSKGGTSCGSAGSAHVGGSSKGESCQARAPFLALHRIAQGSPAGSRCGPKRAREADRRLLGGVYQADLVVALVHREVPPRRITRAARRARGWEW